MRLTFLAILTVGLLLAGCSSDKDTLISGERVSVLKSETDLQADPKLADTPLELPEPFANEAWPQSMGMADGSLGHLAFSREPEKVWSSSIGEGSSDDAKLLGRPIVADGRVFTIDSEAQVRAFKLENGERIWSVELQPEDYDEAQFGGGVTYAEGKLFVSTGYGTLAALNPNNGEVVWRRDYKEVLRSAPVVAGGRLFVLTADGETQAVSTADGHELWRHTGISENSTLLGSGVPVVADDVVFTPYSSGELYAVRVQNGKTLWQQSLSSSKRSSGGMPALSDIEGSPALDSERVYAASNGGRMAAVDKRTGNAQWDIDLASVDTPVIVGDNIFVIASRNTVVVIDRKSGRIRGAYPLPKFEDEEKKKDPIFWTGPVVANGVIWCVSSNGKMVGLDAATGKQVTKIALSDTAYLAPVIARETMLVITDDGRLTAYR